MCIMDIHLSYLFTRMCCVWGITLPGGVIFVDIFSSTAIYNVFRHFFILLWFNSFIFFFALFGYSLCISDDMYAYRVPVRACFNVFVSACVRVRYKCVCVSKRVFVHLRITCLILMSSIYNLYTTVFIRMFAEQPFFLLIWITLHVIMCNIDSKKLNSSANIMNLLRILFFK